MFIYLFLNLGKGAYFRLDILYRDFCGSKYIFATYLK